jgi:hypothetical protein
MVDDNLVKQMLTEWLVLFGTRVVHVDETVAKLSTGYNVDNLWEYVVDECKYIHFDTRRYTWQLTDAGIKHLQ